MISKFDTSRNYSYLAIAAFFGFVGFMIQPTAYTWGEQDMMPFFERVFDPTYLVNDFYTNSTVVKNPRWVFGYFIIAISWVTTLTWYNTLYILKLLFTVLTPILYYKVLIVVIKKFIDQKALSIVSPFVLGCLVLMVFSKEYRYYFSVGSWVSYSPHLHAYNIAVLLVFIGILLKEQNGKWLHLLLFLIACFVHPAMGFFAILFYLIYLIPEIKENYKQFLAIIISAFVGMLSVKFIFQPEIVLPTTDFIDMYIKQRHPWHYHVPEYSNPKGPWFYMFIFMNVLFIMPLAYALRKRKLKLIILALISLLAYSGAILAQYIFIDVYPVKLVAYLGISRFTTFGYWMLVILWAIVLSDLIKTDKPFVLPNISQKIFAFIIINLIFVGILFIDNPKEISYNNRKDFYDFVQSTPKASIFMTYYAPYNTDMRLIGRRGVFVSDEFPFAEPTILEYIDRYRMMYGIRNNEPFGIDYYRRLRPKDFIEISKKYPLDYILIDNSFNSEFKGNIPVWNDNRNSIYEVKNLEF